MSILPPSARAELTVQDVERFLKRERPLSGVEQKAIEYAESSVGEHIRGLSEMTTRTVRTSAADASAAALRKVREGVSAAIANRESISELQTRLFNSLDDRVRDWRRIAMTEMNNAVQNGVYREIREKSDVGEDQMVYKRPNPDACKHCKRLYLKSDGITPKIFKLSDLADSNVGLKADSWVPTIGSVHPHCMCQLLVVPDGYTFVTVKRVAKDFTHASDQYRKGQVVDDAKVAAMGEAKRANLIEDAVLSFTGETPSLDKSFRADYLKKMKGSDNATIR
jgi:hypothetical protein